LKIQQESRENEGLMRTTGWLLCLYALFGDRWIQKGGPNTDCAIFDIPVTCWFMFNVTFKFILLFFHRTVSRVSASSFFWLPRSLLCSAFTLTTTLVVTPGYLSLHSRPPQIGWSGLFSIGTSTQPPVTSHTFVRRWRHVVTGTPLLRVSFQVSFGVLPHYWHPFWLPVWCPRWLHHPRCISVLSFTNRLVHIAT
jgi:hypothetical protein